MGLSKQKGSLCGKGTGACLRFCEPPRQRPVARERKCWRPHQKIENVFHSLRGAEDGQETLSRVELELYVSLIFSVVLSGTCSCRHGVKSHVA